MMTRAGAALQKHCPEKAPHGPARSAARLLRSWFAVVVVVLLQGCGSGFPTPPLSPASGVPAGQQAADATGLVPGAQHDFTHATVIAWDGRGPALFSVQVRSPRQVDVWDLGSMAARSRLSVDLSSRGGEVAMGLFDANGAVLLLAGNNGGRTELFESWQYASDLERSYLVIVSLRDGSQAASYAVDLEVEPDIAGPAARRQIVALNFDGAAAVSIGKGEPFDVPPFEASDLHPDWGAQRDFIMDQVLAHIEEVYAGMDLDFHFASDPAIAGAGDVTVLHFGSWHPHRLGVADRVDYGNRFHSEQAVIHAENFAKYVAYGFDVEAIARGLANVAAHELGHLLGLNHTIDPDDVMNVSPTVFALTAPHSLRPLPGLDPDVFPIGAQDGARRVFEAVGGDWEAVLSARRLAEAQRLYERKTLRLPAAIETLAPLTYECTTR